ncbi:MAG: RluA family pseudouridine synthase, partial [Bdellovibrionota bacterium]
MKSSDTVTDDHYLVSYRVDSGHNGARLDQFLKEFYRRRSREQLKRAIADGSVFIERNLGEHFTLGRLKPSMQVLEGDEVQVRSERKPEPPVCFDYKVLYEDDVILVVDKPANLPVHPAGRYFFNTLLIHLRTQGHRDAIRAGTEFFLVHRIDKETSGVLLLAKDRAVCAAIVRQFAERTTEKRYLAVVHGVPRDEFSVDLAMKRATHSLINVKMMVAPEADGGQSAFTEFRRLSTHKNGHGEFSVLECFPKTGRQHQIRIHLEAAGHPIVGD